jgi:hypothetical protein
MRKLLALLFAIAASAPYCAANTWASLGSAPAPVTTTSSYIATATSNPVSNTTSPYDGFTAVSTPSSSYSGALTTMSSGTTSWASAAGTPIQTAASVVNNTTVSGVSWAPQTTQTVASSVSTYGGSWGSWSSWGSAVQMVSQPSSSPLPVSGPSYGVGFADNPEPGTILTFVGGMSALFYWRRRMSRKNAK